jgi:hypothetical protein
LDSEKVTCKLFLFYALLSGKDRVGLKMGSELLYGQGEDVENFNSKEIFEGYAPVAFKIISSKGLEEGEQL